MYISSLLESRLLQMQNPLDYTTHLEPGRSGVIQVDAEGRIVNFNRIAGRICSLDNSVVKGQRADVVFQNYGEKFLQVFDLANNEEAVNLNLRVNGQNLCLEIDRVPLVASEGKITGLLVVINDVSASYAAMKQLQTMHMLQSLGELAGCLFELKNASLCELENYMRLMLDRVRIEGGGGNRQMVKRALNEAMHINTIIREILFMTNAPVTKAAGVSVNSLLEETVLLIFRGMGGENVNYNKRLADGLPEIYGDANALKQVFINIMQNSLEAMETLENEGALTVKTWFDAEKNMVVVNIIDTGVGISKEMLPRVFEPFYGNKDKHAGLGLTFVDRIVQEHHGVVRIRPGDEKGTNVFLYLPISGDSSLAGNRRSRCM